MNCLDPVTWSSCTCYIHTELQQCTSVQWRPGYSVQKSSGFDFLNAGCSCTSDAVFTTSLLLTRVVSGRIWRHVNSSYMFVDGRIFKRELYTVLRWLTYVCASQNEPSIWAFCLSLIIHLCCKHISERLSIPRDVLLVYNTEINEPWQVQPGCRRSADSLASGTRHWQSRCLLPVSCRRRKVPIVDYHRRLLAVFLNVL